MSASWDGLRWPKRQAKTRSPVAAKCYNMLNSTQTLWLCLHSSRVTRISEVCELCELCECENRIVDVFLIVRWRISSLWQWSLGVVWCVVAGWLDVCLCACLFLLTSTGLSELVSVRQTHVSLGLNEFSGGYRFNIKFSGWHTDTKLSKRTRTDKMPKMTNVPIYADQVRNIDWCGAKVMQSIWLGQDEAFGQRSIATDRKHT